PARIERQPEGLDDLWFAGEQARLEFRERYEVPDRLRRVERFLHCADGFSLCAPLGVRRVVGKLVGRFDVFKRLQAAVGLELRRRILRSLGGLTRAGTEEQNRKRER